MIFNEGYYNPMDREYSSNNSADLNAEVPIESPIDVTMIGQSVTEGQKFGPFRQSLNAALRTGARKVELQTQMGGGHEPVGAEAYGKQAREELREIARANKIEFTSVHAPTQVGNMSGYTPRQGGIGDFSDEQRKMAVEEIKKSVDFAADVTQGGAVVVHTGEYQRPMSEEAWNKDTRWKFLGYQEEPGRAVTYMVDDRTGRIIGDVRKSQTVREPMFIRAGEGDYADWVGRRVERKSVKPGQDRFVTLRHGDLLDKDNKFLDYDEPDDLFWRVPIYNKDQTRFESVELTWNDFERRAREYNNRHRDEIAVGKDRARKAEDMFMRVQLETQILQYRGSSLYHGRFYEEHVEGLAALKKAKEFYDKLDANIPNEEKWKILRQKHPKVYGDAQAFITPEMKTPSEIIDAEIRQKELEMKYTREASAAADAQADAQFDTLKHITPIEIYAKRQSFNSLAEVGIHAMDQSQHNPNIKKDIFIAPEHIFPEMGYGSHPDELIELVQKGRKRMVQYLTSQYIDDPHGRRYSESQKAEAEKFGKDVGDYIIIKNDNYRKDINNEEARKLADRHIKATIDTQHLGMWRKHMQPVFLKERGRMETKEELDSRFKVWYMEQIEKMEKAGIVGHIHLVDAMGAGHHHLPAGQGMLPVVDAIKYLRSKGYDNAIISEGYGEELMTQGRILTETWKAFGSSVYGMHGPMSGGGGVAPGMSRRWDDIHQSYFGQNRPPNYIFGAYSPSNDWTLWTQVPLE